MDGIITTTVCVVPVNTRSVHDSRNDPTKFVPNQLSGADYSVTNNYITLQSRKSKVEGGRYIMIVANPKEATNINEINPLKQQLQKAHGEQYTDYPDEIYRLTKLPIL